MGSRMMLITAPKIIAYMALLVSPSALRIALAMLEKKRIMVPAKRILA